MQPRDHITSETSAFAERLIATVEAAVENVRTEAAAELATLRSEVEELQARLEAANSRSGALAAQLENESARNASLATELDTAAASLREAEGARVTAEASLETASAETRSLREMLESARSEAIRTSEALEAEAAQKAILQQEHEAAVAELEARIKAAADATTTLQASLAQAEREARDAADANQLRVKELQRQLDEQAELVRTSAARADTAEAAVGRMRNEVTEANAIADAAGAEMTVFRGQVGRVTSMITAAGASLETLAAAKTVAELFSALVRELATEFTRAAIFRVKGNHLEGDLAVGVDDSVDIQKLVVPLGMSSVLTKAVSSRLVQHATKDEAGDSRPPFGGSPDLAVAAPLVFAGEVLAVAYADTEGVLTGAHVPFAAVLVRHANAVLGGLSQELRTSRQLRDYARTLLEEVEAMFRSDVDASVPEPTRIERLRANLRFAHDLYAQRAALESPLSTNLLDDEVGRMLRGAEPSSLFASALVDVLDARQHPLRVAAQ